MPRRKTRLGPLPGQVLRVVYYIRVSALMGRGGDDFYSPKIQLNAMRRKTVGMTEVEVIDCDIDRTGTDFEREGIDRVRKLAQAHAFDVLCVYNVKRFGRNTLQSLLFLNELANFGVTIVSATENIDTSTPSGRKALTDLLAGAQMQSEEIGEGWADAIEQRALEGHHHGGRAVGYHKVDKLLVPHPTLGPVMEEAFRRYAAGEQTIDIVRFIAAQRGKRVFRHVLPRWLRMPVYRGLVELNGVIMPGVHKPLMDEQTWAKVQDRLARDSRTAPRQRSPQWSLVGLGYCPGDCRLSRYHGRDYRGNKEFRLGCSRTKEDLGAGADGDVCEGIGRPPFAAVEDEVLRQVHDYTLQIRADVTAAAEFIERRSTLHANAETLRANLIVVRSALTKLTTEWALSKVGEREYKESLGHLKESEAITAAGLAEIEESQGFEGPTGIEAATAAEAVIALWPRMTPMEKNQALRSIVKRFKVRRRASRTEPVDEIVQVTDWKF